MDFVTTTNPATGDVCQLEVRETTPSEVLELTRRGAIAAREVATRPLTWRSELLEAMADELEADAEHLVDVANAETALGLPRLQGELRRTQFQLRFFASVVRDGAFVDASIDHPTESPMGPLPDLRRVKVPLGVVGVFGSSNFPFAFSVPGGDTASALAAGCAVVIKAHPAHPETSASTFAALEHGARRAGAPEHLLALVFGLEAGVALVESPDVAGVGFTGSSRAGTALWERANARPVPIPFFGELGAANPLVVTTSAAHARATDIGTGIAGSMTLGAGQFCTKPGLLYVPSGADGDALVAALVTALEATSQFTMLSAPIADVFRDGSRRVGATDGVRSLVSTALGDGATTGAQLYEVDATQFTHATSGALRDECFGPQAIVVRYASHDELRDALEAGEPALTFSVFCETADPDAAWLLETGARRAGRVIANAYPTGVGVSWSMQHGGPWPSTTSPSTTSVGAAAIDRWLRPVTYQSVADDLLPLELRESNPLGIVRRVDGVLER